MSPDRNRDVSQLILECLNENLFGLTITDISNEVGISRNTAYRYLGILEAKNKIFNKKVGTYNLYYSKKKSMLYKGGVLSFFKALMKNLKNAFPNKENLFKEFGVNIADSIELPFTSKGREQLNKLKELTDIEILESVSYWIPYFNILFDDIEISNVEIDQKHKKAIYTFYNSEMLKHTSDQIYFFYILAGLVERKITVYTEKKIRCNILEYEIYDKKENSFIKVSIEVR